MTYKIITAVATEPVTRSEAKLHARIDLDAEDSLAEHYTGRAFAAQTLEMALRCFPDSCESIELELPPVASVTSIKYTDANGTEQTFSSAKYSLSAYGLARSISLAYGEIWPLSQDIADAVRIRYVTGYTTLPKAAKAALLLIVAHLYKNREVAGPLTVAEIPMGARALLDTVKMGGR